MAAFAVPLITAGISGLAGLFGGKKKQQTSQNTISDSTSNSSSSTTPNLTSQQQGLIDQLLSNYHSRLQQGSDLSGYAGQGLRNINQSSNIARKASDNILAARGLSNSPYAGYRDTVQAQQQGGQSADLLNSLPLLQRSMQGEDLSSLANIFKMIPTAYSSNTQGSQHSNSTTTGTGTGSEGGGLGGLLGGLGAGLAGPNGGSGGSNLASILGNIFGKRSAPFGSLSVQG